MSRNIQTRNILLSTGMVVFSFLILSLSFSAVCYTYVIREKRQVLESTAKVVADVAAAVNETLDSENWELSLQAASISRATGLHIFICDDSGKVIICSDALVQCVHIGETIPSEYTGIIDESGSFRKLSDLSGFYQEKRYIAAVPIRRHNGEQTGYVFAADEIGADRLLHFADCHSRVRHFQPPRDSAAEGDGGSSQAIRQRRHGRAHQPAGPLRRGSGAL